MKHPIEPLTRDEAKLLIRSAGSRPGPYASVDRNRAMIALMWRCGLRRSEVTALWPADIDRPKATVRVRSGKGGKSRLLAFDSEVAPYLDKWEHHRGKAGWTQDHPYFCTTSGRPVAPRKLRDAVARAAKRSGITKRIHPHGLRHTFAMELMEEGVPLNVISKAMGHSNSGTTAIYLDHIAAPEVVNTLRARNWSNETTT
jgi:integrase/recombinase XerC